MTWKERFILADLGMAVGLLALIIAITFLYISNEHTFYVSDYGGYQNITHTIVAKLASSPSAAFAALVQSTANEYNALFTIPLVPWVLLFGGSRMVYEIALGLMYGLPFALILGAVATRLLNRPSRAVFWSTVLLALVTPIAWVPTLRGYPDAGGAALLLCAVWVYLTDTRLKHWWQIPLIGFFLTSSILFRRPFAYAALAFLVAITLHALMRFALERSTHKYAWRALAVNLLRIGLTVVMAGAFVVILNRPFLYRFLTTDYNALYADYMQQPLDSLTWYASTYGWLSVVAAIVGYIVGTWRGVLNSDTALFLSVFGGLTAAAWFFFARQTGEQYTLNFTPFVVLGLAALLWTLVGTRRTEMRPLVMTGIAACLGANMILGLGNFNPPIDPTWRTLFAMQEAPFVRTDQTQVAQLVSYLRTIAGHGEPIYVAASSFLFGKDTLPSAEHALFGWEDAKLNVLSSPEIDSRDSLPLELLLQSKFVVVVEPFQHHLSPERQRVVQVVYDLFEQSQEFAHDFVPEPVRFALDDGAVARIYRRIKPTSLGTAIRTLQFMQNSIGVRPGSQPDWIVLEPALNTSLIIGRDKSVNVTMQFDQAELDSVTLLYLGALHDSSTLRGRIQFLQPECPSAVLRLARVTAGGKVHSIVEIPRSPTDMPDFALRFQKQDAQYLLLFVSKGAQEKLANDCTLELDSLQVVPDSLN